MVDPTFQRIVVIGTSCSGKTTLAQALASTLHYPHIELDQLHWLPNWQIRPLPELKRIVSKAIAGEQWVLDGNYSKIRPLVWARATNIIWLNYPFPLVFWRALNRTSKRVFSQQLICNGNRETFRQSFLSTDSMIWWVLITYHRHRREYPHMFQQPAYQHLHITELRSPLEADMLVGNLKANELSG